MTPGDVAWLVVALPAALPLIVAVANAWIWPRAVTQARVPGMLSVLIRAADGALDEDETEACVRAVFANDHPIHEVLVLDDGRSPQRARRLAALQAEFPLLCVIPAEPRPPGSSWSAPGDVDQVWFQKAAKVNAIRALFGKQLIFGSGSGSQLTGLDQWVSLGFGQNLTFVSPLLSIRTAIRMIQTNHRNRDLLVILTNSQGYEAIEAAAETASGNVPLEYKFNPLLGQTGMYYAGVPVAINDHITSNNRYYVFDRTQVIGLVNRRQPNVSIRAVQAANAAATSYVATWNVGVAVLTNYGFVRIEEVPDHAK